MFGLDPPIVRTHDLRLGEPRAELLQQHGRGDAANRELRGLVEKAAAVERSVHVGIEEDEQFLVEIVGGLTNHGASPLKANDEDTRERRPRAKRGLKPRTRRASVYLEQPYTR